MMDIFKNATKEGSFNNWLSNLPKEDLQYLSDLMDEVNNDEAISDSDTVEQLPALVIHFSGKDKLSQNELLKSLEILHTVMALELNVREGNMTKQGIYSLVDGEDTAKFTMTGKGQKEVKNMIKRDGE